MRSQCTRLFSGTAWSMWRYSVVISYNGTMGESALWRQGCCSGPPHVDNHTIQLLASLLDDDGWWTVRELAAEVDVCHKTVFHILHDLLGYRKIAARWVPHEITEVQQWLALLWNCTGLAETLPEGRWRLPWKDHHYGRNLSLLVWPTHEVAMKWMEAPRLSSSKECAPCTRWCEGDVHCGVWHPWGNAVPCCTSTAAISWNTTFVQHSGESDDTCWQRTPSSFMTVRGVTLLTLWWISFAAGHGRYWNIHHTHPIWAYVIMSSPKWKNHCEGSITTQETRFSVP
jgi:hypothetical protein